MIVKAELRDIQIKKAKIRDCFGKLIADEINLFFYKSMIRNYRFSHSF